MGYNPTLAVSAAEVGVDYYKRCASASAKGRMFDDCLTQAVSYAKQRQDLKKDKKKAQ